MADSSVKGGGRPAGGVRGRGSRIEAAGDSVVPRGASAAVGYLRRSTDRQEQSIGDQRAAVERYAAEIGATLLRFYIDDAISGTSTAGRRAFQQMIAHAGSPERDFGVVIVYDVKRFGRIDNDEAGYYRHLLRQHGVEVRYASEGFSGDSTDDLLRPVKQWQARQESKDLAKVVIRGLVSKAGAGSGGSDSASGAWMGGAPPFGYDLRYESHAGEFIFTVRYQRDGSKALLDARGRTQRELGRGDTVAVSKRDRCRLIPGEAGRVKTVREIFRMHTEEGRGLKAIADALNRRGVPTARGPEWSDRYSGLWAMTTVRAILRNPAYAGDLVWNRRTDARFYRIDGEGRAVERPGGSVRRLEPNDPEDWIVIPGAHPALVERVVWERSQALMKGSPSDGARARAHRGTGAWSGPRSRFVLSGLITCAACGSRYEGCTEPVGTKKAGAKRATRTAYACGGYIRRGRSTCSRGTVAREAMEGPVIEAVRRFYDGYVGDGGAVRLDAAIRAAFGDEQERLAAERLALTRRLEEVSSLTRTLLDTVSKATRRAVERRVAELEAERDGLERRLDEIATVIRPRSEAKSVAARMRAFLERLPGALGSVDAGERHAALRQCVVGVVYDQRTKRATVTLRALPVVAVSGTGPGGGTEGGGSGLETVVVGVGRRA